MATDSKLLFQRLKEQREGAAIKQNPDILTEAISRWPMMSNQDIRHFVKLLCKQCGYPFTRDGIIKLEIDYNQIGYSLWDFVHGKKIIKIPSGMNHTGIYLSGASGKAIPLGNLYKEQET